MGAVIMRDMSDRNRLFLRMAARLAIRGHGGAEPNPLVGAVIVSPQGEIVGWGYHRTFGGPHAEIVALQRAASRAVGSALYCTMEPCSHTGKTPPCADAIIAAGIARVIIARRDPNPIAAGGVDRLRAANIAVDVIDDCEEAIAVSDPFAHRVRSGLPWVIAKWAQTIDGKIAMRTGDSKWISNESSRRLVHRERGRVDVILTGIGTVLADDPMLTARTVRVRRIARRVVIDPHLRIPTDSRLVKSAREFPLTIACDVSLAERETARVLREHGVDLMGFQMHGGELPLVPALRELASRFSATNVLVEAGTGLVSRLFRQKLVNEAWVFIAPVLLGDERAPSALAGFEVRHLNTAAKLKRTATHQRGGDLVARFRIES
jgi:diaminohydroxyphosphoribosylaminopyrimidine deaminase/5-amino-6-(5-phosphoribosylamino)uracil reductase